MRRPRLRARPAPKRKFERYEQTTVRLQFVIGEGQWEFSIGDPENEREDTDGKLGRTIRVGAPCGSIQFFSADEAEAVAKELLIKAKELRKE